MLASFPAQGSLLVGKFSTNLEGTLLIRDGPQFSRHTNERWGSIADTGDASVCLVTVSSGMEIEMLLTLALLL